MRCEKLSLTFMVGATPKTRTTLMAQISNGFGNKKSLTEQINDICKSSMKRRDKVNALIKLGIRENEVQFILPQEVHVRTPRQVFVYTFGVEIECVMPRERFEEVATGVNYHFEDYNHRDNREYFKFTSDSSICTTRGREGSPIECVSPVLDGTKTGFDKLATCCEALNAAGAYVNRTTGLHVHIGARNMTGKAYANVFKNYQKLERVIDTFMAYSRRGNNNTYCQSITDKDFTGCNTFEDIARVFTDRYYVNRYYKVNAAAYGAHGTIEFRQHQGTTDFAKIKNWVNFCAKLVAYSQENVIEREITSISDIPFLTKTEKAFFKSRQRELNREAEAA